MSPFRVPCVPTGMNTGVLTTWCGRGILQALALLVEHSAKIFRLRACLPLGSMVSVIFDKCTVVLVGGAAKSLWRHLEEILKLNYYLFTRQYLVKSLSIGNNLTQ